MQESCRLEGRLEHVKVSPIGSNRGGYLNVGNLEMFNTIIWWRSDRRYGTLFDGLGGCGLRDFGGGSDGCGFLWRHGMLTFYGGESRFGSPTCRLG